MAMVPIMWLVWGAAVVLTVVIVILDKRVGRNEESQLFLAESSNNEKSEQEAIAARLNRIRPLKISSFALAGLMTLLVLVYYVHDAFHQF